MIFGRKGQKKRHPYVTLAVFGLVAAGALSIYSKGKRFFKEKCDCAREMMKKSAE